MVKKSEKFGLILLLALSLTNISGSEAFAENTLNQVDVKKNASDGLEFTLYTSSPYADNVIVSKKSDNKYVILMPNVNGTTGVKPDLSSVKDVVSDVDVRAINDGDGGYTKVTVITNRPVNIKTNTAKSSPVTQEQREYRALIAQQKTKPVQPQVSKPVQQTAPVQKAPTFKLPEIQPTHTAADIAATKAKAVQTAKKEDTKPAVDKKADTKTAKVQTKAETNIKEVSVKKAVQPKIEPKPKTVEQIKKEIQQTATTKTDKQLENIIPQTQQEQKVTPAVPVKNSSSISVLKNLKNNISGRMPKNMPVTLALVIVPLICLLALFNIIRASLRKSQMLKKSFLDNISKSKKPVPTYDNIINNENLSWQEKYQQYVNAAGETVNNEKTVQNKYNFVAKPADAVQNKPQHEFISQQKTEELDRIMQTSPDVEKTEITKDIEEMETQMFDTVDVMEENNSIHNEINKTIKLKAFAEKTALEETKRNKKIKHRRVQLEIPKEAPHVNIGYSQLHTNPRMLKNANLSVSDLIAKSDKLLNKKTEFKEEKNDYDMISLDDYFNIIEDKKSRVTSPLSDVVAESLSKIKDNTLPAVKPSKNITNPISKLKNETKEDYLNGLIVKSGYNIDKERGFYLVSLDGKSAVIGRIGEEVFVLKKFDRNINKPLQVRMDNPNVYMVKADNFKSLVEVNKNQMGVLIEL